MPSPQFESGQLMRLQYGFAQYRKPVVSLFFEPGVSIKELHRHFLNARDTLRNAHADDVLWVAWKSRHSREFQLGRFCKDKLGRIRFHEGWPVNRTLTKITCRDPFQTSPVK